MQTLQENFFFHSNSRLGADGGLENERQLLVEEQKLCRARARKFSQDTNRRRKALEERQKQWDKQEQGLRENILQQRRQRVQDATEKFQRAHLPPSQRRRQFVRRNVPSIEDALDQIQRTMSPYTKQSSFLLSNSNLCRSLTPSPRPPTLSKYTQRQALSAVEAYTKLLQEQSMTCLKNDKQTEKAPEKQPDRSPWDSHLSDCCCSESLSSKDSLENEDPKNTINQPSVYSSLLVDIKKYNDLRKQNELCPTADLTPFSAMTLLGDSQSKKILESNQPKQEDPEALNNKRHISNASWGFPSVVLTPKTEPALNKCNLLLNEIISQSSEHFEENLTSDNTVVTNRDALCDTALNSLFPKHEPLLDVRQQRIHDEIQLKHPSATEILLPSKNVKSKDCLFADHQRQNVFLKDSSPQIASGEGTIEQTEGDHCNLSAKTDHTASINDLNMVSNLSPKPEKSINAALLHDASLSNIQSNTLNCLKSHQEKGVQNRPLSVGPHHSVRFIKGILKKESKYMLGDATCVYGSGHLVFANQVALSIRDSVELTRTKTKEGKNTVKKKLRWIDEVAVGREDKKQDIVEQTEGRSSNPTQSKYNSKDHQLSLTLVSGATKPGPNMTHTASTGYHFTKQAWADVGVQVNLPHGQADEVKVSGNSTRKGGFKISQRERSGIAGAPISSRARKGTVIRPQSATEVNQIAKTQGKIMKPRPPPRIESVEEKPAYINKSPYGMDLASVTGKLALEMELALPKANSEGFFSHGTHQAVRTDSTVMYTPLQPQFTGPVSECSTKISPSSARQENQGHKGRRAVVHNEKGLRLDCTPTDEEISQLWHGVRSALATKDAQNVLRRQSVESGRDARKPCVEQSRQPPGSGNRRFPLTAQPAKQTAEAIRLFSSVHNVVLPAEGFETVAKLHVGEVQAEGLLVEGGNVVVMETAQTQRPRRAQQCSQQQGLTTISLEEQKILLSLERLNQQLYCVREHIGANTGSCGILVIDAPSTKEVKVTNHHKRRASSANKGSRYQKKV